MKGVVHITTGGEPWPRYFIYALHNDVSARVYIGMSATGYTRPKGHGLPCNMKRNVHRPVVQWISKYRALGIDYQIAVLEALPTAAALPEAERAHIGYFRFLGIPLLNCTDGGDGLLNPSRDTREKIAAALRGTKASQETKDKIAASHRGLVPTEITRQKLREAFARRSPEVREKMLAGIRTPEARKKLSAASTGRTHSVSAEAKARLSLYAKNRPDEVKAKIAAARRTPEYRAKMALTRGRTMTDETRAKMSLAWTEERIAALVARNKAAHLPPWNLGQWRQFDIKGYVLKAWRKSLGLSQRSASRLLDIGESTLARIEKERPAPAVTSQ